MAIKIKTTQNKERGLSLSNWLIKKHKGTK